MGGNVVTIESEIENKQIDTGLKPGCTKGGLK